MNVSLLKKIVNASQAGSLDGCRGVSKSLKSVNSIASAKKLSTYLWKGYRGKAGERANPSGRGGGGIPGNMETQ